MINLFVLGGQEALEIILNILTSALSVVICIVGIVFFILRRIVRNEAKSALKVSPKDATDFEALEKLGKLRQEGILTDEEFQKKKNEILNP